MGRGIAQARVAKLVGRDPELAIIEDLIATLRAHRGGCLVVEGEAGIGKSALVAEAAFRIPSAGLRVLKGAAHEFQQEQPFGLVSDLLGLTAQPEDGPASGPTEPLFPADPKPPVESGQGSGPQFVEEMIDLVEAMTLDAPVLLVLEDLQWADAASLQALERLATRLHQMPVGLLVTLRTTRGRPDVARAVEALLRNDGEHLLLEPLELRHLEEIAAAELQATPGPNLLESLKRAGGNPFFVHELLRGYRSDRRLNLEEGVVDVPPGAFPTTIRNTILRRVTALGDEAFTLLRRAAILGRSFSIAELQAISSAEREQILESVQAALDVGLLRDEGDSIGFHHDLVREVLYLDTAEAVRKELHRDVARALAANGATALSVAPHVMLSARQGDAFDVEWLHRAGLEATRTDPVLAADLVGRSIEIVSPDDPQLHEMLALHAALVMWSGDSETAEAVARRHLARQLSTETDGLLRLQLTRSLIARSRFADAVAEGSAALESLPPGPVPARIMAEVGGAHLYNGNFMDGPAICERAYEEGQRYDDVFAKACASIGMALTNLAQGRRGESLLWAERVVEDAWDATDPDLVRGPYIALGGVPFVFEEEFARGEEILRRGLDLLMRTGTTWMMSIYHSGLGHCRWMSGKWDDALAEYETAVKLANETGNTAPITGVRAAEANIYARRGDMDRALEALAEGQRLVDEAEGTSWNAPDVARSHALIAEMQGNVEQSVAILTNLTQMTMMMGLPGFGVHSGNELALIAQRYGLSEVTEQVLPMLQLEEDAIPPSQYAASICARGAAERSAEVLEEGVARFRSCDAVNQRGLWLEEAALVIHQLGHRTKAREWVMEAGRDLEALGAGHDLARLRRRAREIGIHVSGRGRRTQGLTGWASLTKTELAVADLVAEGLRNSEIAARLFISPRTVETHLTKIYMKLGVRSRAQLVRAAAERASKS